MDVHEQRSLTRVVLNQLLERLELGSSGDVVASVIQFTDFIVLDVISLHVVPVLDGEREGPCSTVISHEYLGQSNTMFSLMTSSTLINN